MTYSLSYGLGYIAQRLGLRKKISGTPAVVSMTQNSLLDTAAVGTDVGTISVSNGPSRPTISAAPLTLKDDLVVGATILTLEI